VGERERDRGKEGGGKRGKREGKRGKEGERNKEGERDRRREEKSGLKGERARG